MDPTTSQAPTHPHSPPKVRRILAEKSADDPRRREKSEESGFVDLPREKSEESNLVDLPKGKSSHGDPPREKSEEPSPNLLDFLETPLRRSESNASDLFSHFP